MMMLNCGLEVGFVAWLAIGLYEDLSGPVPLALSWNGTLRYGASRRQRIWRYCPAADPDLRRSALIQRTPAIESRMDRKMFARESVRPVSETKINSRITGGRQTPMPKDTAWANAF